jgi:hypothetical protein
MIWRRWRPRLTATASRWSSTQQQVGRFTREGMGSLAPAPANIFSHAIKLAGPDDRFVSINHDTIYSIAQVDVSGGPVLLRVPDTAGRYYVLQFVDAWTNNFAYVGRRATGTATGAPRLVALRLVALRLVAPGPAPKSAFKPITTVPGCVRLCTLTVT